MRGFVININSWLKRAAASNWLKFALVFAVVNLHSLRHLSLVGFLAVYLPVSVYVAVQFGRKVFADPRAGRWSPLVIILLVAVLGTVMSLGFISPQGSVLGLSRFLFAIPVLFALYLYTDSAATLRKHLYTFVVFFTVSSLTLPLQVLTGPIPWFAASSERGELDRYSSLVGSLTAVGIIVGSYLVLVQAFKLGPRIVLAIAMIVPAVVSLSKAALVNVVIALIVLVILNRRAWVKVAWGSLVLLALGIIAYTLVPALRARIEVPLVSFGITDGTILNYDTTILASVVDRLTYWPLANFAALSELENPLVYVLGGGFGLASTGLVPQSDSLAPMAHNQFGEAITVFGFGGGLLLIASMILILVRLVTLYRGTRLLEIQLILVAYAIFLLNSIFANGTLYQPASASIFYLAMFGAIFGHKLFPAANLEFEGRSDRRTGGGKLSLRPPFRRLSSSGGTRTE